MVRGINKYVVLYRDLELKRNFYVQVVGISDSILVGDLYGRVRGNRHFIQPVQFLSVNERVFIFFDYFQNSIEAEIKKYSQQVRVAGEAFFRSLLGLFGEVEGLSGALLSFSKIRDLRLMNDQFQVIPVI